MTSTHSNYGVHSNSGSTTSTNAQSHSVSFGNTFRTAFPDDTEKTALEVITRAVNDIRRSLRSPNKGTDATVPSSWNLTEMNNLLSYAAGTADTRYQYGTVHANTGGNAHTNTSRTNDSLHAPSHLNHSNTSPHVNHGNSGHADTNSHNRTFHCNTPYSTSPISIPGSAVSISVADSVKSSYSVPNRNTLLEALNNQHLLQHSTVPSFGSWAATHTNHSSTS